MTELLRKRTNDRMGQTIRNLFDYQRFANQAELAGMIADAESRYGHVLDDDDLELVSAAGELFTTGRPEDISDD